ncbi:hypothetical protein LTR48_007309 [Friedmanniomyces endolithicus]|uniref:Late embryogenesis abundant protein LEA-2 subgroup domain-containing protein n=1 Tax=Rachicladosporium monterosium TaxID=1507873 RepID=A0ABR0KWG4_9PEZI|nr:hypothetical protein LTR29_005053 [Friedmanniomyces endolithicus]KAK1090943.1 hypothetical protein LTR48_007309 [Friedmanniomyces endolithicus]KAK1816473.1 hypothetical protein LTR12_009155 [Friedmanniomyces endolithicus]KAK5139664.1 hypothetical protein LTR32_007299 [Rachicladosporium monterosium]
MAADNEMRRDEEDHDDDRSPTERDPLLSAAADVEAHDGRRQPQHEVSARHSLLTSLQGTSSGKGGKRRWPSIVALLLLCVLVILIIVFAFLAPSTVEQYAQQAAVFNATSLSIDSFTSSGIRARVQGDFMMDASRVEKKPVRDLGRFFTYVAHKAESGESEVEVSLPEYGNVVLGTAHVPGVKVDIRNGHTTHVDVLSDLEAGDVDGIRRIANDWLEGRLGQLRVLGKAVVPLKSGIVSLGKQALQQELLFANKDIPSIPAYKIKKLNVRDVELPNDGTGMAADVSLAVQNDYPVEFTAPPMSFSIFVDGCQKTDPYIKLADAETHEVHIQPKQQVVLNVTGIAHHLPHILTQDCPGSNKSPLDTILGKYIHGEENTIYVQGSSSPQLHTPKWITDLISDIIVPVPLPGKTFGHLIKNFSLTDTHFSLPDPFAQPNTPAANPRISANVKALVALPEEMNFNLSVSHVRADATIFYHGKKLGKLDLHKWQEAHSHRVENKDKDSKDSSPTLMVQSAIKNAPIDITDDDVFTDVLQELLFGGKNVMMHIQADVDVAVDSALGELVVRRIPAEGQVPVKPISPGRGSNPGGNPSLPPSFRPKVFGLQIVDTGPTSLTLSALVNLTNPTNYSATIPYIELQMLNNDSVIAHATARDLEIVPGPNENLYVEALWDPVTLGGKEGGRVGREFLSQYISGWNTTITLRMHEGSIPSNPSLGRALGRFEVEIPTPSLGNTGHGVPDDPDDDDPDDPDDDDPLDPGHGDKHRKNKAGPHFISDATFHLLSSTATFVLSSPLHTTTLHITSINATAYHRGDAVGHIDYDLPFAIPPVDDEGKGVESPRLPVEWSLGSVGYGAVRGALGGRLELGAYAEVGVRIGRWREGVWFRGEGIGAGVRL